ncbi:uncharacterized protein LOC129717170 [Wyeomyia smithii]|uniref:uncharacterized protein LOC129717170 n=1 Tax=Wyeomyia smithii TaxID=174621 RepID=UPI002467AEF5|nr:uncharacterized protein LOC129717170 [Wyeomyia smithii]
MPAANSAAAKKAPSMRALTARMKEIQLSFNDIWRFMQEFKESNTATEVQVRLAKLEELWEGFSDVMVEIFAHDNYSAETSGLEKERMEFSDRYYEVKSFLVDKTKELEEPHRLANSTRVGDVTTHGGMDHVRLPQIKLQSFNGDIDEWFSFRDLFTSLIHWKEDLPEVEKFHYLKGCLQGEPKSLIDPLQITRANYQLRKRQVQALFSLPTLTKESVSDLHTLIEGFERIVQTLDQVVQQADYKDLLLVNILTARLDPVTRRGWEEVSSAKEQDTLADLTEFLRRRVQVLDCLPSRCSDTRGVPQQHPRQKHSIARVCYNSSQASGGRCTACTSDHPLYLCSTFQEMTVVERDALLKSHALCRNCFRVGHQAKNCTSKYSCRNCRGRHHTLVCFNQREKETKVAAVARDNTLPSKESDNPASTQTANMAAVNIQVSGAARQYASHVLLATAVVTVEGDDGNRFPARAMLDSGSESNFITERLSQRLKVTRDRVNISVVGIGQASTIVKQRLRTLIRSRVSPFSRELSFLVLPRVTVSLPTTIIDTERWNIPSGIQLADPAFFESHGVDLVLGIGAFFDFFETGRRISLGEQLPTLNESVFGWVICGGSAAPSQSWQIRCNVSTSEQLDTLISRFWACEEVDTVRTYSPEERRCEDIFTQTVQRNTDGRYTVALPKRKDILFNLGDSRDIAFRRLQGTERRLARDENLRKEYTTFMDEYRRLGHMQRIDDTDSVQRCYLPHHPVVKESSTTTKVRVVFDASCKTTTGVSLNDVLLVGPVIQEDLRSIILRSRTKQVMLVSDVEKMFRQINICPEDRPLQCILWRNSPSEKAQTYELNTVTYGTKPAPFLATRTLHQLAVDEQERFPLAASATILDTYMDDVITGADSIETALELRIQLDKMMSRGGFRLRKWASNSPDVLKGLPENGLAIRALEGINLDPDSSVKTLGLTWMPVPDTLKFSFSIPTLKDKLPLTKRYVLSVIATLFDPLGLLGATITSAKIFMQRLWTLRDDGGNPLSWDQSLPPTVGEAWVKFQEQIPQLNELRIKRCVIIPQPVAVVIHCFSDASEKAYGACLYLKSINAGGEVRVHLLSSKSRIAPLKCQTIPRLELCGAELAAKLFEKVNGAIRLATRAYFWTDSTCVLRWISATPTTWSTYVANRTANIQTITECGQWRHVPGAQNPADLISRGILPGEILQNTSWWEGPDWLKLEMAFWPNASVNLRAEEGDEERRRSVIAAVVSTNNEFNETWLAKFSSYTSLIRVTAYCSRFIKLLRTHRKEKVQSEFLNSTELKEAETVWVRQIQKECFADEWSKLSKGASVPKNSPLRWFNPFISKDQVIRLGGRLKNSLEPDEVKHPVALPARHRFTRMLLDYYHVRLLHAGPQLLLSVVRLRFWPLGGRSLARQIIHKCLKCFRSKPSAVPFSRTGVDYFGPVFVRPLPRRPAVKAYVAIFICLCTKAVHMELVTDLSTERFLQALRRFVGRRGRCSDIFSDNGTNFVGARNKLSEFLKVLKSRDHHDAVSRECAKEGIHWHFNPPSAPHFGGIWEAAVRSAKHRLLRVIGETPLSPEDFSTLLVQVEACLNSRPLTPQSDDPNDLEPLTPAHFLIGSSLQAIPEPNVDQLPTSRLNHWQSMQRHLQTFWKRWRQEYLCQLQGRTKRWKPAVPIEDGKLVVVKDENLPPMKWKMGRICQLHPSADNVVRVVTLKTATGNLTRPVEKICLLPVPDDEEA